MRHTAVTPRPLPPTLSSGSRIQALLLMQHGSLSPSSGAARKGGSDVARELTPAVSMERCSVGYNNGRLKGKGYAARLLDAIVDLGKNSDAPIHLTHEETRASQDPLSQIRSNNCLASGAGEEAVSRHNLLGAFSLLQLCFTPNTRCLSQSTSVIHTETHLCVYTLAHARTHTHGSI